MKKLLLYVCFILPVQTLIAQMHDSLAEVQVNAHRFQQYRIGYRIITIDSSTKNVFYHQTLAELLGNSTPVFIRSYGYNNIATASIRGATTEQTAVLWNGFNLQNAALGGFDFSLYPAELIDDISIQNGGNGALFGSGAVGGSVVMQNKLTWNNGIKAGASYTVGSFGFQRGHIRFGFSGKKYAFRFQHIRTESMNDFEFANRRLPNLPREKMTNGKFEQNVTTLDQSITITPKQLLQLNLWHQKTNRQIPPSLSEIRSDARQRDESIRLAANYRLQIQKHNLQLRSAYFNELLIYEKPSWSTISSMKAQSSISEAEYGFQATKRVRGFTGLHYTYNKVNSSGYTQFREMNRAAIFYGFDFTTEKLKLQHTGRMEQVNQQFTPFMPSLGASYIAGAHLKFTANAARSYRLPTLNEMYWQPGGNVHLKPESGWNTDVGAAAFFGSQVFSVDAGVNIYARTIENQILWVSIMGMPSAINARKVNTKGAEYNHTVRLNASELALRYTSQFNFTHAINSESIQHNDNSKNKYVIFVPRISHQHSLACDVQRTTVAVTHQYTGMRYISSDNLQSTDAYHTTNAYLTYRLPINKHQVSTGIHVFNLFNQYYEVMPDRPMPGRNYQFNLTYTFN